MRRGAAGRRSSRIVGSLLPVDFSGMLAMFSAAKAQTTGGNVDSWPQSGGSVVSAPSSTSTNRPTLVTVSGRPFVRFLPASSQRLVETSSSLAAALASTSSYTIYCAVNRTDPGGGVNGTLCGWAQTAGTSLALHACNSNLDQYSRFVSGTPTTNLTGGSVWPSTLVAYASVFSGSSITNYLNASQVLTGANTANIGATSIFSIGCYTLSSGSFGGYLPGDIGTLAIFSGAHSVSRVVRTTRWVRSVYGF